LGHCVGRDVSYNNGAHARIPSALCARKRSARAANGVVVGCSPPRVERRGILVHRWGLVDRPYPLFYSSCRAPTFIPPRTGGSARTCLFSIREPAEGPSREEGEETRKRANRRNRCVSKGRRLICSFLRAVSLVLDSVVESIGLKQTPKFERRNVIANVFYHSSRSPPLSMHSYR